MESWIATVPVVSAFATAFTAGVAWQKIRSQNDKIAELEERLTASCEAAAKQIRDTLDRDVGRLQAEHERSAREQGKRLGAVEGVARGLEKWRAEMRGAERERHRTAAGGVPVSEDSDENREGDR